VDGDSPFAPEWPFGERFRWYSGAGVEGQSIALGARLNRGLKMTNLINRIVIVALTSTAFSFVAVAAAQARMMMFQ